ncbi:hypothetical protein V1525DRAFT_59299 [Lipomyces kononenkoae]|uniref:Uncharacterized protein n=1 Tax=Lipomyces kononenkoae TaxID=34357 RepID=A0ACC3SSQ2_LIPKO
MEFPKLDGDPTIDDIFYKCWHNKYAAIADLVGQTETLVTESTNEDGANTESISITQWRMIIGRIIRRLWCSVRDWWMSVRESTNGEKTNTELANGRKRNDDICNDMDQDHPKEEFLSKKTFCQDLEKHGLLLLSSGEPEQLGFTFEWYRHSS